MWLVLPGGLIQGDDGFWQCFKLKCPDFGVGFDVSCGCQNTFILIAAIFVVFRTVLHLARVDAGFGDGDM